ncbi:MAG: HlyC/CorC family transporter [Candidatus Scalindua sp.]|nr:HlyC/CorC family transporter [Candidatus Scalindua sp.]MBT5304107.1 HlyC/CorC family transporter [Candidatus Scalindua sp.]MBT6046147.1 HlyC/CorC family transporter [Candidatus Scalindua sp.]MBT6228308.1 HlyC/CorC family transporter [Candidatus Scalindua sp.]MBT6562368.1 HlyC/CorC family transporter [Candidatus Scalindua sp.]
MLFLLCFSAFFSATETAFFSLTREEVDRFGKSNSKSERLVQTLLKTPKNLLTTILLGNMLANIGFYCTSYGLAQKIAVDSPYGGIWVVGTVCIISLLTIIIMGEVIPKNIAVKIPDQYSRWAAIPIYLFDRIFWPFRVILTSIINSISSVFDKGSGDEKCVTIDELKMLVEFSEKQGIVDQEERSMIHGILDFKRAQIKEIMLPRVDMNLYDIADPVQGLIDLARKTKETKFPIYEETPDNILGIVHAKDIFLNPKAQLKDILKPVQFVPEPKSIEGLLRQFRREGSQLAIVVDEHGGTAGLITLEDIIEEIVGEIQDEHEKPRETINKIDENKYLISGNLSLRDWSDTFGVEIEPMGVDTIGGLVIALLEHIPQKGDSVKYEDFVFTVEGVRKKRITSILQEIKVKSKSDEEEND